MTQVIDIRNVDVIAAEINSIKDQTRKIVLGNSIEIGKRLVEAKSIVPHGEWGTWLENEVDYSQSTANNLMRIFEEYGANQIALFGADAKSEAIGNLSYTQAVALLGVPAEEREAFIEENDVENMSTRELQAAIKEKQALAKRLEEAEERERAAIANKEQLSLENEKLLAEAKLLKNELSKAESSGDDMAASELEERIKAHEARIQELEDELAVAESPGIPKETQQELETLRQREKELELRAKQIEEAATAQLTELQQQLIKNNNTAAIKVKVCFDALVGNFQELLTAIEEVNDPQEKRQFKTAIEKLCDRMKGSIA